MVGPLAGVHVPDLARAEGGVMSLAGTAASRAVKAGVPIADVSAAPFGVIGVLGALVERDRSGLGQLRAALLGPVQADGS